MNPTSQQAAPQCRGAAVTRQQGPTCRVAGRDRKNAMDATQRTHNRRNAKRRIQKRLATLRKENTPPPPGVASRPGTRSAPALNSNSPRPVPPMPASVDNSTRAQDDGSTRCCRLCDARFVVTSRAVRYFDKQGWQPRTCCYKCTTAKKQAAAAAARAVAEQLKQERRPRSRSEDPVPPAVDILSTADGRGSSSTAADWSRFPMPHAVGHAQTIGTTRKILYRAISTRRSITKISQGLI